MSNKSTFLKGRGAQINTPNKFHNEVRDSNPNAFNDPDFQPRTEIIHVLAKTIVNKVDSPDVPFKYSLNPYQGCEHGCVYCYARNSHNYWGYSAGLDFETKILVKSNAVELLRKKFKSRSWNGEPIMVSGNTDCYQPVERKLRITRSILETFNEFGNPIGLITKNNLILRDLDILKKLHRNKLVHVAISINTLSEEIKSFLEPRTASIKSRLKIVKTLSDIGIPVRVLAAPIIPGLTDHDILNLTKSCAEAGAYAINHIVVRLNGDIGELFKDWVRKAFPDRAKKIISQIESLHNGQLNDSQFGHRMRGSGPYAEIIKQQFAVAKSKFFAEQRNVEFNRALFQQLRAPQMKLF